MPIALNVRGIVNNTASSEDFVIFPLCVLGYNTTTKQPVKAIIEQEFGFTRTCLLAPMSWSLSSVTYYYLASTWLLELAESTYQFYSAFDLANCVNYDQFTLRPLLRSRQSLKDFSLSIRCLIVLETSSLSLTSKHTSRFSLISSTQRQPSSLSRMTLTSLFGSTVVSTLAVSTN
jgi:hypothetical protein